MAQPVYYKTVDDIISTLLTEKLQTSSCKAILSADDIKMLCEKAQDVLLRDHVLLEIQSPVRVIGDIMGEYETLLRIFDMGGHPSENKYIFLGNYTCKGKNSVEVVCLLLAYKIKYPDQIFMLRGSHDNASISRIYGFYEECKRKYRLMSGVWKMMNDCFNYLPIAAIVNKKIFCVHGGLSPEMESLEQIREIHRPLEIDDTSWMCDLLWSDPAIDVKGWRNNDQGVSYTFGADIVVTFLTKFGFELIIRSHQVHENGYAYFADGKLLTVHSRCGPCGEYDYSNAYAVVNEYDKVSVKTWKPKGYCTVF